MKAFFFKLRGEKNDPFHPYELTCYVRADSMKNAKALAIDYFAEQPELTKHFKNPKLKVEERLHLHMRCPDMDDAASSDPAINHDRATMLGLSALTIDHKGKRPMLIWQAQRSASEARRSERALIEHLFNSLPKEALLAALAARETGIK